MIPNLVLVEGLPGTGRSTKAQWLAEQLQLNHIPAKWYYEISTSNPLKAGEIPAAQLPTSHLFDHGLKTWERCVEHVRDNSEVVILDAGLFQHITMQAFRRGCSKGVITNYLTQVENVVLPLRPLIIYISPDDTAQHVEQMYQRRGERFKELIVDWCSDSADANQRGYCGYDGSLRFWSDFDELCKSFFGQVIARKTRLDVNVARPNWLENQKRVLRELRIKPMKMVRLPNPNRFIGTYLQPETSKEFTIHWNNGELCATGLLEPLEQESVLILSETNRLLVRGHDAELEFVDDNVHVHSGWLRINGSVFTARSWPNLKL